MGFWERGGSGANRFEQRMNKVVGKNDETAEAADDFRVAIEDLASEIMKYNNGRYLKDDKLRIEDLARRSGKTFKQIEDEVEEVLTRLKQNQAD